MPRSQAGRGKFITNINDYLGLKPTVSIVAIANNYTRVWHQRTRELTIGSQVSLTLSLHQFYLTEEKLKLFFYKLKDVLMKALKAKSDPDCLAKSNLKLRHINLLLSWRSRFLLNSIQNLVSLRPLIKYSSCLPLDRAHSL